VSSDVALVVDTKKKSTSPQCGLWYIYIVENIDKFLVSNGSRSQCMPLFPAVVVLILVLVLLFSILHRRPNGACFLEDNEKNGVFIHSDKL
jgi:hypothetical protein